MCVFFVLCFFYVNDMEKAVEWYTRFLGVPIYKKIYKKLN
ncbi:VOC family protein [Paenibacillus sp. MDMC362]|nr:hypothetical protein DP091_07460 [Paenibacillus sp. MDMC362]